MVETFKDCAYMQPAMTNQDADFGGGWSNSMSEIDDNSCNGKDNRICTNNDIISSDNKSD